MGWPKATFCPRSTICNFGSNQVSVLIKRWIWFHKVRHWKASRFALKLPRLDLKLKMVDKRQKVALGSNYLKLRLKSSTSGAWAGISANRWPESDIWWFCQCWASSGQLSKLSSFVNRAALVNKSPMGIKNGMMFLDISSLREIFRLWAFFFSKISSRHNRVKECMSDKVRRRDTTTKNLWSVSRDPHTYYYPKMHSDTFCLEKSYLSEA